MVDRLDMSELEATGTEEGEGGEKAQVAAAAAQEQVPMMQLAEGAQHSCPQHAGAGVE